MIFKLINFKDFIFVKVILEFKIFEKYYKVLGDNIVKIVEGVLSDDKLVFKFIDDFGLSKLLLFKGILDLDVKELFKLIFKVGDIKGVLSLFIDGFFKDISKFKDVNLWVKFIFILVGVVDEFKVKEYIKKWMR